MPLASKLGRYPRSDLQYPFSHGGVVFEVFYPSKRWHRALSMRNKKFNAQECHALKEYFRTTGKIIDVGNLFRFA
jgi:hypothetical protein